MNRRRAPFRAGSIASAAVLGATAAVPLQAAWEVVPEVELTGETNDNARFTLEETDSTSRAALDARLRLRNFGERGSAFIEPRIVTEAYGDAPVQGLENNDMHLITQADYAWERVSIDWRSNFREQSVLRAEFQDAIPDNPDLIDPIDTSAGTLGVIDRERRRFDAALGTEISLSERTSFGVGVEYIDVAYSTSGTGIFDPRGFEDTTLSATLSRALDERSEVSARVFGSEFTAAQNDNLTRTFGVEGGLERPLSETWSFSLTASVERLDYRFVTNDGELVDNADSSVTFLLGFRKRTERTRWTLEAGRLIAPNSTGFRSQRDQIRVVVRRDFTQRLTGRAGLRYSELSSVEGAGFVNDRDYSRGAFELAWDMTPRWALTGGYDVISESFGLTREDVVSNSVFIGVRYQGRSRGSGAAVQGR